MAPRVPDGAEGGDDLEQFGFVFGASSEVSGDRACDCRRVCTHKVAEFLQSRLAPFECRRWRASGCSALQLEYQTQPVFTHAAAGLDHDTLVLRPVKVFML